MNARTTETAEYDVFYVTREAIARRPRNLEGYRIPEHGWYVEDLHTGEASGPYATARLAHASLGIDR